MNFNYLFFILIFILNLFYIIGYTFISYHKPLNKEQQESERIQSIVSKCYQNSCRQWVLECHWFCDAIRGLKDYERCLDCLRTQGMGCYECFDL
ncbi:hypothetical protein Mgra_00000513 [Meloidogyne graminicola]|uniref:Uncharacterized protein n=1 Tax=Meloidogyne graminicola TaxID=189291 RepID=A0A8T0A3C7_9BILA|nr:hypothetical protein Mgra_00000513 [Meloidogyne graminicola]